MKKNTHENIKIEIIINLKESIKNIKTNLTNIWSNVIMMKNDHKICKNKVIDRTIELLNHFRTPRIADRNEKQQNVTNIVKNYDRIMKQNQDNDISHINYELGKDRTDTDTVNKVSEAKTLIALNIPQKKDIISGYMRKIIIYILEVTKIPCIYICKRSLREEIISYNSIRSKFKNRTINLKYIYHIFKNILKHKLNDTILCLDNNSNIKNKITQSKLSNRKTETGNSIKIKNSKFDID